MINQLKNGLKKLLIENTTVSFSKNGFEMKFKVKNRNKIQYFINKKQVSEAKYKSFNGPSIREMEEFIGITSDQLISQTSTFVQELF
jgi:hypothetical protein